MKKIYSGIVACCIAVGTLFSQSIISFTPLVTSGLSVPSDVVSAKDGSGRLFIVEQSGLIKIYTGDSLLFTPFLNLSSIISYAAGGERGLLSLVFHPGYSNLSNGYFFVYYTATNGAVTISRYRRSTGNPNIADPASAQVILSVPHGTNSNHNGGKLNFGPDGNLYFGLGDGGGGGDVPNNAQTGTTNLGKMLRINVDNFNITTPPYYTIPATNPFAGNDGINDEIFALGLRNPWRWSFDRLTGDMWIADVGQSAWEEVNFRTPAAMAGTNYGWRCYEGTHQYDFSLCGATPLAGKTMPIFEYPHNNATGGFSITGGYVYRGTEFPGMQGYYIFCDYLNSNGWLLRPDSTVLFQNNFPVNITSFGEGEDGSLFAVSRTGGGRLYKIVQSGILPIRLFSFSGNYENGFDMLHWTAATDDDLLQFEVERSTDATRFSTATSVPPRTGTTTASYDAKLAVAANETRYYRLKMASRTGLVQYSGILKITNIKTVQPTVIYQGAQLQLITPAPLKNVTLVNNTGQVLKSYSNIAEGSQILQTGSLHAGIYWLRCQGKDTHNLKFVVW